MLTPLWWHGSSFHTENVIRPWSLSICLSLYLEYSSSSLQACAHRPNQPLYLKSPSTILSCSLPCLISSNTIDLCAYFIPPPVEYKFYKDRGMVCLGLAYIICSLNRDEWVSCPGATKNIIYRLS